MEGAPVQGFLYKDQRRIAAELDGSGNLISQFTYVSGSHSPDYMTKGGNIYRFVKDQVGSPRLVVNVADGSIAQELEYDEFGGVLTDTNPGFQPFGLAGGLYDAQTGLVRFGARDYDPEVGRWTAKDPIRFAGDQGNLYVYVNNNPVNFTDPYGLFFCNLTSSPLLVGGGTGSGKGHGGAGFGRATLAPGQCVGPDNPAMSDNGEPLYDVDVADFDRDGVVEPSMSIRDSYPFGEKVPLGSEDFIGVCAVDADPTMSNMCPSGPAAPRICF